jgi:ankyrin repeat protein
MEPLGIVASIIAVFQASDRLLKLLSNVQEARNALNEIQLLEARLSCVQLVLIEAREYGCPSTSNSTCRLCPIIGECDKALSSLQLILQEIQHSCSWLPEGAARQVVRARWWKRRAKIQSLKKHLKELVALLNLQVILALPSCRKEAWYSKPKTLDMDPGLAVTPVLGLETRRICLPTTNGPIHQQPGGCVPEHLQKAQWERALSRDKCSSSDDDCVALKNFEAICSLGTASWVHRPYPTLAAPLATCPSACECQCHEKSQYCIPICQARLGVVIVRFRGLKIASGRSGESSCRRHDAWKFTIVYIAPAWLYNFALCLTYINMGRPPACLSLLRVQRPGSAFVTSVRAGDRGRVCELLTSGAGHISDIIYPYGISVLQLAIQYNHIELSQFLIEQGAEDVPMYSSWTPDEIRIYFAECSVPTHGISASDVHPDLLNLQTASDIKNRFSCFCKLPGIFGRNQPRLHRAVLGTTCKTTLGAIRMCGDDIDEVDSLGMTALAWAVNLESLELVSELLALGADPNIPDIHGRSPMHFAAALGLDDLIEMLGTWGAQPDLGDRFGDPPFHYAALAGRVSSINCLIKLGVAIDNVNCVGESTLMVANRGKHKGMVQHLVDCGHSLYHRDVWGFVPALDAVFTDSHEALEVYISAHGWGLDECLFDGQSVLHIAARNSKQKTIETLLRADLRGVDPQQRDSAGKTAMDYFKQREDSSKLMGAFCALIEKVKSTNLRPQKEEASVDLSSDDSDLDNEFFDTQQYTAELLL